MLTKAGVWIDNYEIPQVTYLIEEHIEWSNWVDHRIVHKILIFENNYGSLVWENSNLSSIVKWKSTIVNSKKTIVLFHLNWIYFFQNKKVKIILKKLLRDLEVSKITFELLILVWVKQKKFAFFIPIKQSHFLICILNTFRSMLQLHCWYFRSQF